MLWGIIPFGQGLAITDFSMGILYTVALSSLGVYGILFAGWSSNSKYSLLGSLRSSAAMISYELILSAAILIIILLTGTFNFTLIIESQQSIWFIIPLLPVFIFFFIFNFKNLLYCKLVRVRLRFSLRLLRLREIVIVQFRVIFILIVIVILIVIAIVIVISNIKFKNHIIIFFK